MYICNINTIHKPNNINAKKFYLTTLYFICLQLSSNVMNKMTFSYRVPHNLSVIGHGICYTLYINFYSSDFHISCNIANINAYSKVSHK